MDDSGDEESKDMGVKSEDDEEIDSEMYGAESIEEND